MILLKGHSGQNGQIGVLLCRENGGFHIIKIGKSLKHYQIGPCILPCGDHFPVQLIGFVKFQRAQRLQQLSDWSDVQSHQCICPLSGRFCHPDRLLNDLPDTVAGAGQFVAVGLKGVGVDQIAACGNIAAVDVSHHLRRCKTQDFRALPQLEAGCLQLCAHGAVQDQIGLGL